MKKLLLLAALALAAVYGWKWLHGETSLSLVRMEARNPYPAASPLHGAAQAFVDGVNSDEAVRARFAGVFTKRGLYSELRTALARGAKSLDGPVLSGATTAMARVVPHLPRPMCARLFREHTGPDQELSDAVATAFGEISPRHYANLMDFYLQALKADAHDAPQRPLDQEALRMAMGHLGDTFQGEFAQRFVITMQARGAASDEDLCWAGSTLLHGVTLMGDQDRDVLSRCTLGGK